MLKFKCKLQGWNQSSVSLPNPTPPSGVTVTSISHGEAEPTMIVDVETIGISVVDCLDKAKRQITRSYWRVKEVTQIDE